MFALTERKNKLFFFEWKNIYTAAVVLCTLLLHFPHGDFCCSFWSMTTTRFMLYFIFYDWFMLEDSFDGFQILLIVGWRLWIKQNIQTWNSEFPHLLLMMDWWFVTSAISDLFSFSAFCILSLLFHLFIGVVYYCN